MEPTVSIIVPCYNERQTLGGLLQSISCQTYPRPELEVIVADGMSTDGTPDVVKAFASSHPGLTLRLVENPKRTIPSGLNRAIEASSGRILIRLDAHSAPDADYVRRCVDRLASTGAANVGGKWQIEPSGAGWMARSIAAAGAHPLGAGDARYRTGGKAGPVDTVPFGAFPRAWVDRVGPFDESLLTNEDYEFNVRLRKAGGVIWFDPAICATYYARSDLAALARQYARYGYWKARMVRRYPTSLRWRQALPPAFVLSLLGLVLAGIFAGWARLLLVIELVVYLLVLLAFGLVEAVRRGDPGMIAGFPLAIGGMHVAWGGAFLAGIASGGRRNTRER